MSFLSFTIEPRHCAVRYRRGVLEQVLPAGRHRRRAGERLVHLDLRERLLPLSPQEVLTADGVSVRISAVVRWAVGDPVAFVEVSDAPTGAAYLAAQVALRDAVATLTADELVSRGAAVPANRITADTADAARRFGVDVAEVVRVDGEG